MIGMVLPLLHTQIFSDVHRSDNYFIHDLISLNQQITNLTSKSWVTVAGIYRVSRDEPEQQNRTEQNWTEQTRTELDRTERNGKTVQTATFLISSLTQMNQLNDTSTYTTLSLPGNYRQQNSTLKYRGWNICIFFYCVQH